ncbi:MAG: alpha/beta hydrolase [Pseudomonadota bacterium]
MTVETCGTGQPMVLIAGNGGGTAFWSGLAGSLAVHFKLIAFDYRDAPKRDAHGALFETAERKADDIGALLDTMDIPAAIILGHSTGAQAAARFAAAAPQRVVRLVFSGGFLQAGPYVDACMQLRKSILETLGPSAFLLDGLFRAVPPEKLFHQLETDGPDALLAFREAPDPVIEAERIDAIRTGDIAAIAPTLSVPTSVVHARDDSVFPFQLGDDVAAAIPNSDFIEIEEGGHLAPMMAPDVYGQAILKELT